MADELTWTPNVNADRIAVSAPCLTWPAVGTLDPVLAAALMAA